MGTSTTTSSTTSTITSTTIITSTTFNTSTTTTTSTSTTTSTKTSSFIVPNNVLLIQVKTSDCHWCGMHSHGHLFAKICGSGQETACCVTPLTDDFEPEELSIFDGSDIGDCNGFDIGSYGIDYNNFVTLYHNGTDAGKFDCVKVFTHNHSYKCAFSKLLHSNDQEVGHDCHQTG